ncbi:MAG: DMT family transporter [Pseudomonadota bacterium]
MKTFVLTAVTMIAFAANSVLGRLGLVDGDTGPIAFAAIRIAAGALMLIILIGLRGQVQRRPVSARIKGAGSLLVYVLAFSAAYVWLPAGLGALILFGVVQLTMFGGALYAREDIPATRWAGMGMAFAGLVLLLWPVGGGAPHLLGSLLMAISGVGWGLYSLFGRGQSDPLGATAGNFLWAVPATVLAWALVQDGVTVAGAVWAVLSGAVTSALGYALWYTVLPRLKSTSAAVAQLTVPVIATAGGVLFLGEDLTLRFVLATVIVLGGIAVALCALGRKA